MTTAAVLAAADPHVLAAGEIMGKLNSLTTDFGALIPRVMQVGALAFVLYKLVTTRSFFKTAMAALGAALVLMLTGNMPVLSGMFKSEVTSMPAIQPAVVPSSVPSSDPLPDRPAPVTGSASTRGPAAGE